MQITIKYNDSQSFTKEEIVRQAVHNYGKHITVDVLPDSTNAHDIVYFGLQQMIIQGQLSLLFDKGANYHADLKKLRAEVLFKVEEILDTVIIDNESKVA